MSDQNEQVKSISKTLQEGLDAADDAAVPKAWPVYLTPVTDLFDVGLLEGDVAGYGERHIRGKNISIINA